MMDRIKCSRKISLNRLCVKQPMPQDEDYTYYVLLSIKMYFKTTSSVLCYWSLFLCKGDPSLIAHCALIS